MSRQRAGLRGVGKLRRTLRRIEPEARAIVQRAVQDGAQAIEADMITGAPVDDGDLQNSISIRYSRDKLSAVVGPAAKAVQLAQRATGQSFGVSALAAASAMGGNLRMSAGNKALLFQAWKAYWVEFGTKGSPELNIAPQPARPFIGPAVDLNRTWFANHVQDAIRRAMRQASRGSGTDELE